MRNTRINLSPTKICSLVTSNVLTALYASNVGLKRQIKVEKGLGLLTSNYARNVRRKEKKRCTA